MTAPTPLTGTSTFRLMPTDDFASGPSSATISGVGGALVLAYTWVHPADGDQHGHLLVGAPGTDSDAVTAAWSDSWHQQPDLLILTGTRAADSAQLAATYMGDWGWQIDLDDLTGEAPTMTMRNVIPESALADAPADMPKQAGPYAVMVAHWAPAPA